jgi:TonB family protein
MVITEKGEATDITVVKTSDARFNDAAIEAVKQWKFHPAEKSGAAVAVKVSVPLQFHVD